MTHEKDNIVNSHFIRQCDVWIKIEHDFYLQTHVIVYMKIKHINICDLEVDWDIWFWKNELNKFQKTFNPFKIFNNN